MKIIETPLPGALIVEPRVFGDSRGHFYETFNSERFAEVGLPTNFGQANVSRSSRGVLRGLHFQWPEPQGKLVWVVEGEVWDVGVDIRRGSPTYGRHHGVILSASNHCAYWLPPGFAHGFLVLSEFATFTYLCTRVYRPAYDRGIAWNDPDLGIDWPLDGEPILSAKDQIAPRLQDVAPELLPG